VADTGVGAVFNLGQTNSVNATSKLTGSSSRALEVANTNTNTNAAEAIRGTNNRGTAILGQSALGLGVAGITSVQTDEDGRATVRLPDYFEALNRDFRYQPTSIGGVVDVGVEEEIEDNAFVVRSEEPRVKVSWQVTGIRRGPTPRRTRSSPKEPKARRRGGPLPEPRALRRGRGEGDSGDSRAASAAGGVEARRALRGSRGLGSSGPRPALGVLRAAFP